MIWTYDVIGSYVLILTLAALLVLVLVLRKNSEKGGMPTWLAASFLGFLLGGAVSAGVVKGLGYNVVYVGPSTEAAAPSDGPSPMGMPGGGGGGGMGMAGMGMGMGGGGMGTEFGGMGGGQPSPKRQLATLVRKLELLTGDIAITLTPEQAAGVAAVLEDLDRRESLTDEEAQAKHDELLAMLNEDQKAKQEAIGLPRGGGMGGIGGGRPGGGRPGGGPGGPPSGAAPSPEANPFADGENSTALNALRQRLSRNQAETPVIAEGATTPQQESPGEPPQETPEDETQTTPAAEAENGDSQQ